MVSTLHEPRKGYGLVWAAEARAGVDSRAGTPEYHPGVQKGKIWLPTMLATVGGRRLYRTMAIGLDL